MAIRGKKTYSVTCTYAFIPWVPRYLPPIADLDCRCNCRQKQLWLCVPLNPRCTSHRRCPSDDPTWCISKYDANTWVQKHGQCDDSIGIQCDATDICATTDGLFFKYNYSNTNLYSAHSCVKTKCEEQWGACCDANSGYEDCETSSQGEKRLLAVKIGNISVEAARIIQM